MLTTLIAFAAISTVQQQSPSITPAEKKQTIDTLLEALKESYVFPELAIKAEEKIKKLAEAGEYEDIEKPALFAAKLSKDINEVLNDAHFGIRYSKEALPERQERSEPSLVEIAARRKAILRANGGVEKIELLPGNIGYIEVTSFMAGSDIARPAAAAFEFLTDTDALIIDLRRNGGGSPEAVRILCSYLFGEEPVHLNSIYWKPDDSTTEYWTLKELPAPRYVDKPVYVLTTKRTGSAAEEFTYNLQTRKRATIVGKTTWGGANPGGSVRLNDHFRAFVPMGRAINPITQKNWEGTGVIPDVDAEDALVTAQIIALKSLIEQSTDDAWTKTLERALAGLEDE